MTLTEDPDEACVFLVIIDFDSRQSLKDLSHWNGDGRNHILLYSDDLISGSIPSSHRAMLAKSTFIKGEYRPSFDLILPYLGKEPIEETWKLTHGLLPIRRMHLLSFQGQKRSDLSQKEADTIRILGRISDDDTDDTALMETSCADSNAIDENDKDWALCGDEADRSALLLQSTFALIFAPQSPSASSAFQRRLHEAFRFGAIPVVIGEGMMPFSETIDWRRAVITVPYARSPELHFLLRSFTDADLFTLRRQGNLIWKEYLSSPTRIVTTLLHVVRERLGLPPPAVKNEASPNAITTSNQLTSTERSVPFRRNLSSTMTDGYDRWNNHFDAFILHPHTPWDPTLPTDAKFVSGSAGFRPIGGGAGGSGREFSKAIGGNVPAEQFTVVMLTFEREEVNIL